MEKRSVPLGVFGNWFRIKNARQSGVWRLLKIFLPLPQRKKLSLKIGECVNNALSLSSKAKKLGCKKWKLRQVDVLEQRILATSRKSDKALSACCISVLPFKIMSWTHMQLHLGEPLYVTRYALYMIQEQFLIQHLLQVVTLPWNEHLQQKFSPS